MNNNFVYIWQDNEGIPFYVGQGAHRKGNTIRCIYQRMFVKHRKHIQVKWNELEALGNIPNTIIYADNLTKLEADALEVELIAKFGRINNNSGTLLNITAGGRANSVDEDSVRNKLKDSTSSNWKTETYRNNAINGMKKSWNEERKAKAAISLSNKWLDDEQSELMRNRMTEQRNTEHGKIMQSIRASDHITYNGVYYSSKKVLANSFNINPATCRKRLKLGIPLDNPKWIRMPQQHE